MKNKTLKNTLLTTLAATVLAAPVAGVYAEGGYGKGKACDQGKHQMAGNHGKRMQSGAGMMNMDAKHIDGKMAFLKAEIKINADQEQAWAGVEQLLRNGMAQRPEKHRMKKTINDVGLNAVDRIERHVAHMEERLAHMRSMQSALTGLYAVLDDGQKSSADELLPMMRKHKRHM